MNCHTIVPKTILEAIVCSNQQTNGDPELPAEKRGELVSWLRRVVADYAAFEAHLSCLRNQANMPRRLSLADQSSNADVTLKHAIDSLYLDFCHHRPLEEAQAFAVAEQGVEILDDAALTLLALNPAALADLAALIEDNPSKWWRQAFRQAREHFGLPMKLASVAPTPGPTASAR